MQTSATQTPASQTSAQGTALNETLDTKAARRVLLNNIKWLHARIETLDLNTSIGQQMYDFYSSKIKVHQHCLRQMNAHNFNRAA